jgi:hypothetical protein
MAIMEMKAVLAALVARFEFTPAYVGQTIRPKTGVSMGEHSTLEIRPKGFLFL